MKLLFKFWINLIIFFFLGNIIYAQAWTKAKGKGFYKADFTTIQGKDLLNNESKRIDFDDITNSVIGFYSEFGITDKITVVGYLPALVLNKNNTKNIKSSGFGDVDLGFRFALPIGKVAMTANVTLGLPTGNSAQIDFLNTGDGEFNQIYKIAAGAGGNKWWSQASLGMNNRSKNYSDEVRFDFEIGYKFFNERLLTILKLNGVDSRDNGTARPNPLGLYSNNVGYIGIGPELLYYINIAKTTGINARFAGAFSGRNITAAPQVSIGFFKDIK